MWMLWFVLDDPNRLDEVLDAWSALGVNGVTIVESTGIQRRRQRLPMRYRLEPAMSGAEVGHYTLMAIVPDETWAHHCLAAVEALVGDLDLPHTGVFAAWPLALSKGVPFREAGQ